MRDQLSSNSILPAFPNASHVHTIFMFTEVEAATLRAPGADVHMHAQNTTKGQSV